MRVEESGNKIQFMSARTSKEVKFLESINQCIFEKLLMTHKLDILTLHGRHSIKLHYNEHGRLTFYFVIFFCASTQYL